MKVQMQPDAACSIGVPASILQLKTGVQLQPNYGVPTPAVL
jgi:hypothetical protein